MSLVNDPITACPVHLIYRLQGSLPVSILRKLNDEYIARLHELKNNFSRLKVSRSTLQRLVNIRKQELQRSYQTQLDFYLHSIRKGPRFLCEPGIAEIILESWHFLADSHQLLIDAISIMPNHVHVLLSTVSPEVVVCSKGVLKSHRKWTSRRINRSRGTCGQQLWATPFFDRRVRMRGYNSTFWYVLDNPVKAGLCTDFSVWPGNYWRPALLEGMLLKNGKG